MGTRESFNIISHLAGVVWLAVGRVLYTVGALALRLRPVPLCHEVRRAVVPAASARHNVVMFH